MHNETYYSSFLITKFDEIGWCEGTVMDCFYHRGSSSCFIYDILYNDDETQLWTDGNLKFFADKGHIIPIPSSKQPTLSAKPMRKRPSRSSGSNDTYLQPMFASNEHQEYCLRRRKSIPERLKTPGSYDTCLAEAKSRANKFIPYLHEMTTFGKRCEDFATNHYVDNKKKPPVFCNGWLGLVGIKGVHFGWRGVTVLQIATANSDGALSIVTKELFSACPTLLALLKNHKTAFDIIRKHTNYGNLKAQHVISATKKIACEFLVRNGYPEAGKKQFWKAPTELADVPSPFPQHFIDKLEAAGVDSVDVMPQLGKDVFLGDTSIHAKKRNGKKSLLGFLKSLPGVGFKTAVLCAYYLYGVKLGLGTDIHVMRMLVSHQLAPRSAGPDKADQLFGQRILPKLEWITINKTVGTIAQILQKPSHHPKWMIQGLLEIANRYDF